MFKKTLITAFVATLLPFSVAFASDKEAILQGASSGEKDAQYALGVAYSNGRFGDQDIDKSIFWMEKAAANGSCDAMYHLGVFYAAGLGVEKNIVKSLDLATRSESYGNPKGKGLKEWLSSNKTF